MPNPTPKLFDGYTITREAFVRGGSGVVHDAIDSRGRRVAIKVLDRAALEQKLSAAISEETRDPEIISRKTSLAYEKNVERFKEEYRNLVSLNHPNIAKVYEMGFREGSFFIVYEYVDGKPLAEHVFLSKPADMIPLFVDVLKGLDYIHRNGLLHLDIKSENILVRMVDGEPEIKIIDFGLSMAPADYKGWFLGSVNYMAPEIVLGLKDQLDARADLFSFGVLMYYCITWGSHPYARPPKADRELMQRVIKREPSLEHDPPSRTHQNHPGYVPEFLDKIVMRLIAHDPKDRFYANARAVINALRTKMPNVFCESLGSKGSYLRPIGDRHIGNEVEQTLVFAAIDALALGETPSPAVVEITGEQGAGKSHLLKKIKEHAERYADKLVIKKIELPADEVTLKRFSDDITLWASENKMPAVVLVDGLETFPSPLYFSPPLMGGDQGEGVRNTLTGLFQMITSRKSNPALYSGQKHLLIAFTRDARRTTGLSLRGLRAKRSRTKQSPQTLAIPLSPFTPADLKQYLASTPAFAGKKVPDEFVSKLHKVTDGIQAEVDAHLRERDSDGMLFNLDGEIVVGDFKRHKRPPATTEARLQKTYEGLLPEERRILDFLSVWSLKQITPPPDFKTISHLIPSSLVALHLNNLSSVITRDKFVIAIPPQAGEAIPSKSTYSFTNSYFSTLIYNQLDEKTKTRLHDSIAKCLSSFPTTIPSPSMGEGKGEGKGEGDLKNAILLHQGFGSNKSLAIRSLVKLAKTTLYDKGRADLAAWLIEKVITLVGAERVNLQIYLNGLLAESYLYMDRLTPAKNALGKAREITANLDNGKMAWLYFTDLRRLTILLRERNFDEAFGVAQKLIADLNNCSNLCRIVLLNFKARIIYERVLSCPDHPENGLKDAKAVYLDTRNNERFIQSFNIARITNNDLGSVLDNLGDHEGAVREFKRNLARGGQNIFAKFTLFYKLAQANRVFGNYRDAVKFGKEALKLAREMEIGRRLLFAHRVLSNIYHDFDFFDEALEEAEKCLSASSCTEDEEHHRFTSLQIWLQMGHIYKEKKDTDRARVFFDAVVEGGAEGQSLMSAYQGLGEVFYQRGETGKTLEYFDKAEKLLKSLPKNTVTKSHESRITAIKDELRKKQN